MINPYLVFNGNCKDALDFYHSVFPCDEPKIMNYGDYMPEGTKTPPELLQINCHSILKKNRKRYWI